MNKDIHGRDRLLQNTIINWLSLAVTFISGFILPRLVSDSIGQEALGIWDFAWSMVGYFQLITGGVISSINRYIAKYRASENENDLQVYISTAGTVVRIMGFIIILVSFSFLLIPETLFGTKAAGLVHAARIPVFLLGVGVGIQITASIYSGVLTGFHRWDIYNGIQIGTLILSLMLSIIVLRSGGGIAFLALAQLIADFCGRVVQIYCAKKIYPAMRIQLKEFSNDNAKKMIVFGSKTYIWVIANLLSNQTISILVGGILGPAALAMYSRPLSLIRQMGNIIQKYTMLLVPTVGSLQSTNDLKGIQRIAISSTRIALCISLPLISMLFFLGNDILHLWMGDKYRVGTLLMVFAIGGLFEMAYLPLRNILMGMNMHGRIVGVILGAAVVSSISAYFAIVIFHTRLIGVGIAMTLPIVFAHGIVIPAVCAKSLKISLLKITYDAWKLPVLCVFPYCLSLALFQSFQSWAPILRFSSGIIVSGMILAIIYYLFIIPKAIKLKIIDHIRNITYSLKTKINKK